MDTHTWCKNSQHKIFYLYTIPSVNSQVGPNHLCSFFVLSTKTNCWTSHIEKLHISGRHLACVNHVAQDRCYQGDPLISLKVGIWEMLFLSALVPSLLSEWVSPSTLTPGNNPQCHSCIAVSQSLSAGQNLCVWPQE
mgnify:CR=1 FL=1